MMGILFAKKQHLPQSYLICFIFLLLVLQRLDAHFSTFIYLHGPIKNQWKIGI